jgi:hypothetical protein
MSLLSQWDLFEDCAIPVIIVTPYTINTGLFFWMSKLLNPFSKKALSSVDGPA